MFATMMRLGEVTARFAALLALLAIGAGGCTTDHDALARQPKGGNGGGGAGGSSGAGGVVNTGNQPSEGGRPNPDIEPAGDNVLSIVNGIVDAPSVRLCFARLDADGTTRQLVGDPLAQLDYAGSSVLTELPGLSFADDMIEPWVLAGDLSLIEDLDCEAAVELAQTEEAKAAPEPDGEGGAAASSEPEEPALRVRPVAALPAGTVDVGRSILMVLAGCLGGPTYVDAGPDLASDADSSTPVDPLPLQNKACGADYEPESPTLQPIVVKLSRQTHFDAIGLQAVHASLATESLDVRAASNDGTVALVFASALSFGAIEPRPADTRFTPEQLGVDQGGFGLQVVGENGSPAFGETWSRVFTTSGVDALFADRTYTTIFVGASPFLRKKGWWNQPAFALVDNDPTRKITP
jgi:hypothetical protein